MDVSFLLLDSVHKYPVQQPVMDFFYAPGTVRASVSNLRLDSGNR